MEEVKETVLRKLTDRAAQALAARDCAQVGKEVPADDHELWAVWNSSAEAVIESLRPELEAFYAYDKTINWMTACTACAKVLDSSYTETTRREMAELTLQEIAEWAHSTRHGHAAGEVVKILKKGEKRLKEDSGEAVANPAD